MRVDELIISLAYFSIPASLTFSLVKFSRLHTISTVPRHLLLLGVLFALFILLCGIGHLLRSLDMHETTLFLIVNILTCTIGVMTAVYIIPTAPTVITTAEKSYQDLVNLNEETAASKRKLFTFMNFLCHEIRNPLFAITSNIEFAQDMPMTPDLYESLTGINQSAHLMLRLVNDVLDLSKIESGKLQLEPQQFNLEEFFNNMANTMGRQVMAKHQGQVKFVFHIAPDIPKMVQADSTRLLQICYNVLSNSNKFTERGSISFTILVQESCLKSVQELNENANNKKISPEQPEVNADVNGMASLENFSFSALSGKARTPKDKVKDLGSTANSSVSSITRFQNRLIKALPSSRSVGSHSDISMDVSNSAQDIEKGKMGDEDDTEDDIDDAYETVTLQLIFEDTGIGIEEEHLGRIFQPYTQSKLSDFRRHGGTGLGLSIIHKLLEMMEGTVKVTSKVGEGTKFVILLPVKVLRSRATQVETGGNIGAVNIDIDNPRPSREEQHAMAFARLDEKMMSMEMDEVELSERDDHVTPLSSSSSNSPMVRNTRATARTHPSSSGSSVGNVTPLSSASSCDSMLQKINAGATNILGCSGPERDGAATPITGNKALLLQRQYHPEPHVGDKEPLFANINAPPLHQTGSVEDSESLQPPLTQEQFPFEKGPSRTEPLFHPLSNTDDSSAEPAQPKPIFEISPSLANKSVQPPGPLFALPTTGTAASNESAAAPTKGAGQPLFGMAMSAQNNSSATPPLSLPSKIQSPQNQPQPTTITTPTGQQGRSQNSLFSMEGPPSAPLPLFSSLATNRPPTGQPSGPLTSSAPAPMSAVPGQPRVRQLAKFNFPKNKNMVLVVDDNGVNRKLLGKMLSYFNLQYQDAEHGKQAVEIMEQSQNVTGDESAPEFGLVLMDLCMPVMDGYEAIRQLRNKLKLTDVPILALTASAMEDEKQKALRAGATEFATKPLLRPALHKKCLEYLQPVEEE